MTNGGITEGHTENSGCSDLSPVTFFGGGETRMQMREALGGVKGPLGVLRHLAPICFMIKYLALLIVGASVSYGQQFNGTVFDLDTGRIQAINGTISSTGDDRLDMMLRHRANQERWAMEREIREQTRLLREIANQQ